MAYVDFIKAAPSRTFGGPQPDATPVKPSFGPIEWSVVALARSDSLCSLRAPGRLARAMGALFGGRSESPVADPRLEMLRRVAVHGWHRGFAVPESEIRGFLEAGYSPDQLELLLTSISRARSTRRQRV